MERKPKWGPEEEMGIEDGRGRKTCKHENFRADVNVGRILRDEKPGAPVEWYPVDIRIRCLECGVPFEFVGVEAGLSPSSPMCSVDALELRVPIRPQGSLLMPAVPGFSVRIQ